MINIVGIYWFFYKLAQIYTKYLIICCEKKKAYKSVFQKLKILPKKFSAQNFSSHEFFQKTYISVDIYYRNSYCLKAKNFSNFFIKILWGDTYFFANVSMPRNFNLFLQNKGLFSTILFRSVRQETSIH